MKKILTQSYLILNTGYLILKQWFDPSLEGNPYEKGLPEERPFLLFGQSLKMRLSKS